jgi:hypothetical protein
MAKEQTKTEKLIEKVADKLSFNPYNKLHMGIFLAVVAAAAGAAGWYGLKAEKKEEKKK